MKAVICTKYGPPEVLQIKDIDKPAPGRAELCIKVIATAVTASDCIIRGFKVNLPFWIPMALAIGIGRPRKPVLGMVFAGEIEAIGTGVTRFKKGDKVFGFDRFHFGAYAEYKCISEDGIVVSKPESVSFEEAAAAPFGGLLALHFLRKGQAAQNQKILIYGASGAIGTSAVQIAKILGADVTAVCSTRHLECVKDIGADHVIDYTSGDFAEHQIQYDLVLNAVGKKKVQLDFKKNLAPNGKYVTVDDGSPALMISDLILLRDWMAKGLIKAVIDRTYPLEDIVEAHSYVDKGHKKGNVIITVHSV